MAAPTTEPTTASTPAPLVEHRTGGVRLSWLTAGVYPGHRRVRQSEGQRRFVADLSAAFALETDPVADTWRGHSFVSMSEDLLTARAAAAGPLPALDHVLLAYQTPDLHVADAAGCYLTERCPGQPQSLGVSEQGAGAPFTALRVADALVRGGALVRGLLFVLDQTSPLREPGQLPDVHRDTGVVLDIGAAGDVELLGSGHVPTDRPALALAEVRARHGDVPVVVGTALAACLPLKDLLAPGLSVAPADHAVTSAWFALAARWPLRGPVLLADYDRYAGGLYTACLAPVGAP